MATNHPPTNHDRQYPHPKQPPPISPTSPSQSSTPSTPSPTPSSTTTTKSPSISPPPSRSHPLHRLLPPLTPKHLRYDPSKPPQFSLSLNLLFAFASTFTVANLYYSHPILDKLAESFDVTGERASSVPTVSQAGYAAGLLLICPLGDLVPRRPLVILAVGFTAIVWIGLCITPNFSVFCALSFVTSLTTVTPQIMLPLVGDLAPPHRRATALSLVVSGLLLGILIARLLSGILTEFTDWRAIYWVALALQSIIVVSLYFFLPAYPAKNVSGRGVRGVGKSYAELLWSMLPLIAGRSAEPLLIQTCLIGAFGATTFTSFWTTLTFLLSSPGGPYHYSSLVIGLFALIGIASLTLGPVWSRFVIDRFRTHFSVLLGLVIIFVGTLVGTFVGAPSSGLGGKGVVGPIIQAFLLDFGLQSSQIANRAAIYGIRPEMRNRTNTLFMLAVFVGQIVGTAVGNAVYARHGWKGSGGVSLGFIGCAVGVWGSRGPNERRWVGWKGGFGIRKEKEGEGAGELDRDGKEKGGERDEEKGEGGSDGQSLFVKAEKNDGRGR